MVHENSDDGTIFQLPLAHRKGHKLSDLMTLQDFIEGGYDFIGGKILVIVKSLGQRKLGESVHHAFCVLHTN